VIRNVVFVSDCIQTYANSRRRALAKRSQRYNTHRERPALAVYDSLCNISLTYNFLGLNFSNFSLQSLDASLIKSVVDETSAPFVEQQTDKNLLVEADWQKTRGKTLQKLMMLSLVLEDSLRTNFKSLYL